MVDLGESVFIIRRRVAAVWCLGVCDQSALGVAEMCAAKREVMCD